MAQSSRAFRIFVSAGAVLCGLACPLIIYFAGFAEADTGRTYVEPRFATPVEISQAALDGQIEALRKVGFDENCLSEIEMYGKLCIEQCIPKGTGFALQLNTDLPRCSFESCTCEDDLEPAS